MVVISNVFPEAAEVIGIPQWLGRLTADSESVKNCFVTRVLHAKNLASTYTHEYLHVLVYDTESKHSTRLIVERASNQDHVVVGFWKDWLGGPDGPPAGTVSTPLAPLPAQAASAAFLPRISLPLRALNFSTPLPITEFAQLIADVTARMPDYSLINANCYWFATTAYKVLETVPGIRRKLWPWEWFYALPILSPEDFINEAREFAERKGLDIGALGVSAQVVVFTPEQLINDVAQDIQEALGREPTSLEIAFAFHKLDTISLQELKAITSAGSYVPDLSNGPPTDNAAIQEFLAEVSADPNREGNIQAYDAAKNTGDIEMAEGPLVDTFKRALEDNAIRLPTTPEYSAKFDEALKIIVGGILRERAAQEVVAVNNDQ